MELNELIPGEIYFVKSIYNWIFKFLALGKNTIEVEGCLCTKDNDYYQRGHLNPDDLSSLRIATLEEIDIIVPYLAYGESLNAGQQIPERKDKPSNFTIFN